ncbi:MAG: DUF559 domain-containing protein [Clostridia bacterium]|nr:DUF559 domain-containing protein [Clostridia bacterium]
MSYRYNRDLVSVAQLLRKNMTKEERHLWYDFLKKLPVPVKRQKNIGNYIVDFFIERLNTVIELDGSQHGTNEHAKADRKRDEELRALGIRVLRYTNLEINQNFTGVCQDILKNTGLSADPLLDR